LGIIPDYNGLMVNPCIPKNWDGYKISREFRGARYNITINNAAHVSKGVKKMIVDGKEVSGNIIPLKPAGSVSEVEVIMG
jgi:cellobiose phosphorylase